MKHAMDAQTVNFVERMGLSLEADGLPRIAGRIFGLLLVSEEARSLDDLASELRVSKGSASTNARLLEQRGLLERACRRTAGTTTLYRRSCSSRTMAQRLAQWQRFHEAIRAARTRLPIRSPDVRNRLQEYEQAYTYMSQVIREALSAGRHAGRTVDRGGSTGVSFGFKVVAAWLLVACVGCLGTPSVGGVAGVPPSPNSPWTPPPAVSVRDSVARP